MNLRRYEDIIAIQTPDGIVAYNAHNMEVAELSPEAFAQMSKITLKTNAAPVQILSGDDAAESLKLWQSEQNLDVKSGYVGFGIKSLTLNVTQICNLKCTYCAAGGDGTYGDPVTRINVEKTLPQLKYFLDKLPDNSSFNLSFVGGEPFLYPEAMKVIYDYIQHKSADRNINCKYMVTTNGTLMTEKALELLQTMKIHVTVSLDGTDSINDQVRPTKNGESSTAQTLRGIEKLVGIRSSLASIGISGVYSAENLTVKDSYLFFKTLGVDWFEFNFSYTEKSKDAQQEYLRQMGEIAELAWKTGGETELRRIKAFNAYFNTLDSQQRVENFCGAGKSYLMIDAKNQLYTCPWVVGEANEIVGRGSDLDHAKLEKYQKPLIELNNCQTCWAKYICGGGCMFINRAHTGDKHLKDEMFCERTRGLILLGIMYYKRCRA
ncbi:MAG: radical SAM/SPASM domain-containing protein [Bdellovibrionales bacterium RIFCSPHIGHO2_01_FULL_40_29]|nr:MAG: radical SAM/SPASM domain-containing protein [Bdellovibrionales bacterium RIFCSPHIGHO2_01_FULL_40_29]OFZ32849.1 MAG: radical SAM/SPASM domain-containing protein [Bdellovibrionales bacterium RIFCSPHIGHO2_02_FULL_40_15]